MTEYRQPIRPPGNEAPARGEPGGGPNRAGLSCPEPPAAEVPAVCPFQANTGHLPPALRGLALNLLVETIVPLLNKAGEDGLVLAGPRGAGADGQAGVWTALRGKCGELSALVLRADDPEAAAEYVFGYLQKRLDYAFETLPRAEAPPAALRGIEMVCQAALRGGHEDDLV